MKNSLPLLESNQLIRGQSNNLVAIRFKMGGMMARFEVVKQFSRLSHQGNLKEATSLLLREIFCEFVMTWRFPFCQRDPYLLPIFLLCQVENVDFAKLFELRICNTDLYISCTQFDKVKYLLLLFNNCAQSSCSHSTVSTAKYQLLPFFKNEINNDSVD